MSKQVIISDSTDQPPIHYTMVETVEDVTAADAPFCFAPDEDLIKCINEGNIILINQAGGYCFFDEEHHTMVAF